MEMQPYGATAKICVVTVGAGNSCDAPEHLAHSGVAFRKWAGGTLPTNEEQIYHKENTEESWTMLSYMLITAALVYFGGPLLGEFALGAEIAELVAGAAEAIGGLEGATALSSASYYAGSSIVNDDNFLGGCILCAQESYLGTTGNGFMAPTGAGSDANVSTQVQNRMIEGGPTSGLSGVSSGYNSVSPTTSSYKEYNTVAATRARYQACVDGGFTGAALRQCASPTRTGVFSNVFE